MQIDSLSLQPDAGAKVKAAEDAWNTRDPEVVAKAYAEDSQWRNRDEFFTGRGAIKAFLTRKWAKELDYKLMNIERTDRGGGHAEPALPSRLFTSARRSRERKREDRR